jgi:hypothetical protein
MAGEGGFFGRRPRKGPKGQQTHRRDRYLHWVKTQDIGRVNGSDTQDSQSTDVFHGFSLFEMAKWSKCSLCTIGHDLRNAKTLNGSFIFVGYFGPIASQ